MSKPRPGRKLAAAKRRVAREVLRDFYSTEAFSQLPGNVQLALKELCPVRDTHPTK